MLTCSCLSSQAHELTSLLHKQGSLVLVGSFVFVLIHKMNKFHLDTTWLPLENMWLYPCHVFIKIQNKFLNVGLEGS
jgi:hypothetical protein